MRGPQATFALRERLGRWLRSPVGSSVAGAVGTGGVLALIGPFGTYEALGLGARLLYWLGTIGAVWAIMELTLRQLAARVADRLPRPRVSVPLLGAALVVVPATAVVWAASRLASLQAGSPADLLWKVGLLLVVIALIFGEVRPRPHPADAHAAPDRASAKAPVFVQRLPAHLTGQLQCLQQEDHYLRVHTTDGSDLIHCRMADAERELADLDGRRVHRSWWVARAAVAAVERDGGRPVLRLTDGRRVPVGKTYRAALKRAGWL